MANMLYNGVELPELPEWDRAAYPYAILQELNGNCRLNVSSKPLYAFAYSSGKVVATAPEDAEGYNYEVYASNPGSWAGPYYGVSAQGVMPILWANYDVYFEDGTFYLAATDPVPVSSDLTSAETLQWISLGMAVRRGIRARGEATMYSYNGVVLPDISPFWSNKDIYQYAVITDAFGATGLKVRFLSAVPYVNRSTGYIYADNFSYVHYKLIDGNWVYHKSGTYTGTEGTFAPMDKVIWTSVDIKDTNGNVFLQASEPKLLL